MESNPGRFWRLCICGFIWFCFRSREFEIGAGEYEFDFGNDYIPEMENKIPFVWGRFHMHHIKKEYHGYLHSLFS